MTTKTTKLATGTDGESTTSRKKKFRLFRSRRGKDTKTQDAANSGGTTPPSVVRFTDKDPTKRTVSDVSSKSRRVRYQQPVDTNNETTSVKTDAAVVTTAPRTKIKGGSWLSRTTYFQKMADWAFEVVDADGSGDVDEKELYSGLLLIHLKLGCYAGPAACRPVSRERVHDIFIKMDVDHSGSLDREEFHQVMTVLCSNVLTRVMVQWSMTLIIVPLVAQYILDGIYFLNGHFWEFVMDLDEYSPTMDKIEVFIEGVRDDVLNAMPAALLKWGHKIVEILEKVPESVWNTVPLTLLSCVLGCLAVPYIIFKIDDYFASVAERKKANLRRANQES